MHFIDDVDASSLDKLWSRHGRHCTHGDEKKNIAADNKEKNVI